MVGIVALPAAAGAAATKTAAAKATNKSKGKKPRKAAAGQREMLLPITGSGKRAARQEPKTAEKPARAPVRSKKAG